MTILVWSNACDVIGNSTWHGLDQLFLPVLYVFALQLTCASSRWFVEGSKQSMEKMGKCTEIVGKKEAQREITASCIKM